MGYVKCMGRLRSCAMAPLVTVFVSVPLYVSEPPQAATPSKVGCDYCFWGHALAALGI